MTLCLWLRVTEIRVGLENIYETVLNMEYLKLLFDVVECLKQAK